MAKATIGGVFHLGCVARMVRMSDAGDRTRDLRRLLCAKAIAAPKTAPCSLRRAQSDSAPLRALTIAMCIVVGTRVSARGEGTGTVIRLVADQALVKLDLSETLREIGIVDLIAICQMLPPPPPATPVHAAGRLEPFSSSLTVATLFRPVLDTSSHRHKRRRGERPADDDAEIRRLYSEQKQRTDGICWSPSDEKGSTSSEDKSHGKEEEGAPAEVDVDEPPAITTAQAAPGPSSSALGVLADAALAGGSSHSHFGLDPMSPRFECPSSSSSSFSSLSALGSISEELDTSSSSASIPEEIADEIAEELLRSEEDVTSELPGADLRN